MNSKTRHASLPQEVAHRPPRGRRLRATPGLACDTVTRRAPYTSGSLLIIDDEPSLVRALARLLQRDGYVVATASNGRHALAALQVQRSDVILGDLRMPELDGRAFYTRLRQHAPTLCQRVIFLKVFQIC